LFEDLGIKYKIIGDEVESIEEDVNILDQYPGIPLRIQCTK